MQRWPAILFLCCLIAGLGCSGLLGSSDPAEQVTQQRAGISGSLKGTLFFNRAEPLEAVQVMALDLSSGRFRVAADGGSPSTWGDAIAYLQLCSPLALRLSVTDADGFVNPVSECVKRDNITPDFFAPALSPDGKRVAITNTAIPDPKASDNPLEAWARGKDTYAATQIFDLDGQLVAEFRDMGPATFTRKGELLLAGAGGSAGYGIYRADKALKKTTRIDDGRIKAHINALDASPSNDRVAFVFNSALFEMDLSAGKPKRLHAHGYPLAGVAYAPKGKTIAFVSADPLQESYQMEGPGYSIFVYDEGEIEEIRLPFIPGAPLDWVR